MDYLSLLVELNASVAKVKSESVSRRLRRRLFCVSVKEVSSGGRPPTALGGVSLAVSLASAQAYLWAVGGRGGWAGR